MGSDAPPEYNEATGRIVFFIFREAEESEWVFHALAENGVVQMPLMQTFRATRFGSLTDQFGIPWMVKCGCEKL